MREYILLLSALMQQIKIANMNANDPAMTIISPMNAGMLVLVWIGNKYLYLYLFCVSYINRFLVSILRDRGLRPRVNLWCRRLGG